MTTKKMSVIICLYSIIEWGGESMNDVRDALRNYIDDKNLLRASIARKANMSPDKLSNILNKRRKLDANEFFVICDVLEVTPDGLMNRDARSGKAS